jgi:hypothetical protein
VESGLAPLSWLSSSSALDSVDLGVVALSEGGEAQAPASRTSGPVASAVRTRDVVMRTGSLSQQGAGTGMVIKHLIKLRQG